MIVVLRVWCGASLSKETVALVKLERLNDRKEGLLEFLNSKHLKMDWIAVLSS